MLELIQALAARPAENALLTAWPTLQAGVLAEALTIQAIPAPTVNEHARARYVEARFKEIGLEDVALDDVGNVYGRTEGSGSGGPALMISAHLDTVFPADTDLGTHRDAEGGHIYGPGLGDNSLGLAAMLAMAGQLAGRGIIPAADIWWVATVGEEGLGDLRGMRRAFERLGSRTGAALILEGIGLGRIYHAGLGVRRLRVTARGPGGHSWLNADRPSAIHHLLKLGAALVDEITPSEKPRSAFNIGLIGGGTSINTRAPEASLSMDLRSEEAAALAALESQVAAIVGRFAGADGLEVQTEVIGDRPSATLPVEHPLVRAAQAILHHLEHKPIHTEIGSTDANIPLASGVPAVCIGVTTGGNAHTAREFIDTGPLATGMCQLTLLALLAVERIEAWSRWDRVDA
jgi:tripeptide aminopeptidase